MNDSLHTLCLFSVSFFNAIKYVNMAFIGSGQISNQCFSSILFSILPTLISFTECSWGGSSFHTQSSNSDFLSFVSCAFLLFFTVTRAPCGEAEQPVWMFACLCVCLCNQHGSMVAVDWMRLIRLLGGWRWKLTPVPSEPADHGLVEMRPAANSGLELSLELGFPNARCQISRGKQCPHLAGFSRFGLSRLCWPRLHLHSQDTSSWDV